MSLSWRIFHVHCRRIFIWLHGEGYREFFSYLFFPSSSNFSHKNLASLLLFCLLDFPMMNKELKMLSIPGLPSVLLLSSISKCVINLDLLHLPYLTETITYTCIISILHLLLFSLLEYYLI